MINLDRHIEILLLSNDCVIVPGLGGFMAHHAPARYYDDSQSFIPPMRQLGFNAQLQINDSLLAQSYIEAYDISYPEALKRIASEVEELKQTLRNTGECELHGLGCLSLALDGHIEFIPCEAGILTPNLYGLDVVDIPLLEIQPLPQKNARQNVEESAMPKPVPHLATAQNTEEPAAVEREEEEDYEPYIKIKYSTLRHIATSAAVILLLFVCSIPFGKLYKPEIQQSYMDSGILYNILPDHIKAADTTHTNISFCKAVEKTDSMTTVKNAAPKTLLETPKGGEKDAESTVKNKVKEEIKELSSKTEVKKGEEKEFFSIVIASQVARANAEEYVRKLHSTGLQNAEVIEHPKGRKVIYGRFKTQGEAYKYLNEQRSVDSVFRDGWVMRFSEKI